MSNPDLKSLMRTPAGLAKKPPTLPIGDYPGVIKSFESGNQNANKTNYIRFHVGLTGWPDSVPQEDRVVDLAKRQMRRDFYMTPDALYRMDNLLTSCGIILDGVKSYEELVPQLVGASVIAEVQQYVNERSTPPETANNIGGLRGAQ